MKAEKQKSHGSYRRLAALMTAVCLIAVLPGCGQNDAEETSASGIVQPTAAGDTGDAADGEAAGTSGDDGARIEMDEEMRRQLTVELLEENGKDASAAESESSTRGCVFDVPEGFAQQPDVENLYVTERYPYDSSMIYYEILDGDPTLQLMTEEMFGQEAEEMLKQTYGENVSLTIDSYESVTVSGFPAFRILCHYTADDIDITQLEYMINADKTYAVTYSQTSDYDWMEMFEQSADTIRILK